MARPDGRAPDQLRPIVLARDYLLHPEGSVLVTGSINICPVIDGISATPAEVQVSSSLTLGAIAHDADAGCPLELGYGFTASGLPEVDSPLPQIFADERKVLVALRVAAQAPLHAVTRQLADAERWRAQRDRDLLARLRMESPSGGAIATPHLGGAVEDLAGLAELARNLVHLENA